jgi:putative Mn2+ efflux pump MntP
MLLPYSKPYLPTKVQRKYDISFVYCMKSCIFATEMSLIDIILLAVALAMDCLTVSIVSGVLVFTVDSLQFTDDYINGSEGLASKSTVNLRMAFFFGLFQAMMPLIGWLGISHFQTYMEAYDHWIAFGLLAFIGGRMVWESLHPEEEQHFNPRRLRTQLLLAVATSIDALAVGISFACTGYTSVGQLTLPLIIIGAVSFLFSLIGYQVGARFGKSASQRLKPELLGGVILILIGVKILASHLLAETI